VELHRRHGCPIALISFAITAYYVASAVLIAFVGDVFERFGPRSPSASRLPRRSSDA
jgi:hypothetical protein